MSLGDSSHPNKTVQLAGAGSGVEGHVARHGAVQLARAFAGSRRQHHFKYQIQIAWRGRRNTASLETQFAARLPFVHAKSKTVVNSRRRATVIPGDFMKCS